MVDCVEVEIPGVPILTFDEVAEIQISPFRAKDEVLEFCADGRIRARGVQLFE